MDLVSVVVDSATGHIRRSQRVSEQIGCRFVLSVIENVCTEFVHMGERMGTIILTSRNTQRKKHSNAFSERRIKLHTSAGSRVCSF